MNKFTPYKIVSEEKFRDGYVCVDTEPRHKYSHGHSYQLHRIIMENLLGRHLLLNERVHHKDGDPCNNAVENLEVVFQGEHNRIHLLKGPVFVECQCPKCGKLFFVRGAHYRKKIKHNKTHQICCSHKCGANFWRGK